MYNGDGQKLEIFCRVTERAAFAANERQHIIDCDLRIISIYSLKNTFF